MLDYQLTSNRNSLGNENAFLVKIAYTLNFSVAEKSHLIIFTFFLKKI
jgi:hypothetical protein